MIIPDINLLVYAHNSSSKYHKDASRWVESVFTGPQPVGIAWVVALGFIRLLSNPKVVKDPDRPEQLIKIVQSWFTMPSVQAIAPGMRHLEILHDLFKNSECQGNLTTDVHLAALAIELNGVLYSNDRDFGRFEEVKWKNPIRLNQ